MDSYSAERIAPALGLTRIVIGVGLIARPGGVARALGIDANTATRVTWLSRMAGAREVALGLGTLQAWRRGDALDGWVAGQAISDGVDAAAFVASAHAGHVGKVRGYAMAVFAASGAVSEVLAAYALRRR